MTATNKTTATGLAASLAQKTAAEVSELNEKAARTMALAEAYDAHGYTGPAPWIVRGDSKPAHDGDMGTLHFQKVTPDELAALLESFEPIPRAEYKARGCRYFSPGEIPVDAEDVRECDGVDISLENTRCGGGRLRATWSAMVGEIQTGFWIELENLPFLHPRTHRHAVTRNHEFLRYEGPTSVHWPDKGAIFNSVKDDAALFIRQYAPVSDQYHGSAHIRGGDVLALVRAWVDECNRRGEVTRAAYEADAVTVRALGTPSADDIAAQCERSREKYASTRMRAGTLEQTAALETPHALADKALAEKHWPAYAADRGMETRQNYFEHYAWACEWLKRCGLYEVPVTDDMRISATGGIAADVQTYRYGSRWL